MALRPLARRTAIRAALVLLVGLALGAAPARAQASDDPAGSVSRFGDALLKAMRAGRGTPFAQRYALLAPAVDNTFDLDTILRVSVGPQWANMPADQKAALKEAFRRYTIANFAANFDSYDGQTIQVNPEPRSLANDDEIVSTQIMKPGGDPVTLAYVMRQTPAGWKAVDVLANGNISRVATQRSDFRSLLLSGGPPALVSSLQSKVAALSG